ncbi:carbamoyltransferase [Modestobacter muralis]|uniref:Carbamoyltransferase n=1 Tax=Modestobacter muralis TaxID=1608614 RepID=A0A6P0H469_9ACTN|nr:carbamoyltransferase [Modestobacter muralis]NEN50441.1 carbamoyltransferase [Modestobacter muralis]
MKVLGINAIYHDPSAALVVDGVVVAAAEEERFSRRKHGKRPLPWSAWELPELSAAWCLEEAGIRPEELDAVAYSFDPALMGTPEESGLFDDGDVMRKKYAEMAPDFLAHALPGLDPAKVRFVKHHVAHAASAGLAAPARAGLRDNSVLVLDGRGEAHSHLAGRYRDGQLEVLAGQALPHSLGLMYEDLTDHLGFLRSSDEFKVMAMASYGKPRFVGALSEFIRATDDGGFRTDKIDYTEFAPRLGKGEQWTEAHADLAASVQQRLEEVLIDLASWVHAQTGDKVLTLAGGTALNCVANTRILAESPFEEVWVQPAAGDAGTALGAALHVARELGEETQPMPGAALGRGWTDEEIEQVLITASIDYERPDDVAEAVAEVLADNGIVAWFQGRSEFGPRALGRRSLMAHPGFEGNLERMNDVKGREQFRPVAPMVLLERAPDIFSRGPIPSPYMLFVHDVAPEWRDKIPTVTHVDGTARIQTIDPEVDPLVHRMISAFERRTGLPIVVNTSLNTAGRPMVDDPRDALECFGSAPVDLLAIGPFVVRRPRATPRPA